MAHLDALFPYINAIVGISLAGAIGALTLMARSYMATHMRWMDANTQRQLGQITNNALNEGARFLMTWLQAEENKNSTLTVNDPITRFAAQIAVNHAPGILSANGASPEEVAAKILARLPAPSVRLDTTGAKLPAPPPIQVKPLGAPA